MLALQIITGVLTVLVVFQGINQGRLKERVKALENNEREHQETVNILSEEQEKLRKRLKSLDAKIIPADAHKPQ